MHLAGVAAQLGGELVGGDVQFDSVSIDTRTLRPGDLYVAIKGANFDGNEFVSEAERKQACAAIVSRPVEAGIPRLQVEDTSMALGRLGMLNRLASTAKLVGITGSQGKTTVKEMTGRILAQAGSTLITSGNLNNAIGVPLTLLLLDREHRFGVIEMGANHAGEIAYSVGLVRPDVAIITNAAHAHIEGFGSLDGVARAKGEIIDGLGPEGTMVLNHDDAFFAAWKERAAGRRVVSFSMLNPEADYFASELEQDAAGRLTFCLNAAGHRESVSLNLLGRHNVGNALAACALAVEAGASVGQVKAGLESIEPVKGRLCPVDNPQGGLIIDDSYNASPDSFKAAIDVLEGFSGLRILLVGDMAEQGDATASAHRELGEYARSMGVDALWSVGEESRLSSLAFGQEGRHFPDKQQLIEACKETLLPGVTLLVKGSRSAGLDEIVRALGRREDD